MHPEPDCSTMKPIKACIWSAPEGYYFSDEAEQLHGPYPSLELTERKLEEYIKELG